MDLRLKLILNFQVLHLRDSIRRVVKRYNDSASSAETSPTSAVKCF